VQTVYGHLAAPQREPAVLGPLVDALQEPLGARLPAACHRVVASHDAVVAPEPGGHPGGAADVAGLAVQDVGPLLDLEAAGEVVEPAERQPEPLEGLGALAGGQRRLVRGPCVFPATAAQGLFRGGQRVGAHALKSVHRGGPASEPQGRSKAPGAERAVPVEDVVATAEKRSGACFAGASPGTA
jgi:hypothetical protein